MELAKRMRLALNGGRVQRIRFPQRYPCSYVTPLSGGDRTRGTTRLGCMIHENNDQGRENDDDCFEVSCEA